MRWAPALLLFACTSDPSATSTSTTTGGSTSSDVPTTTSDASTSSADTSTSSGPPPIFDLGAVPDAMIDTGAPICDVTDDMDAVGDCKQQGPANSFTPVVEWTWSGAEGEGNVAVTPLVANLTDDDGNGTIDLCDIPDVVVVTYSTIGGGGHVHVLDGATGDRHFRIDLEIDNTTTPALGDIDGDGLPEIVTATQAGNLVAFEHDGALAWTSAEIWSDTYGTSLALADLDADGDVEILAGGQIFDHTGQSMITLGEPPQYSATTAADLDDDGDLEVILGHAAYHHDGTPLWETAIDPGFPQVGNLDDDPEPEVLVTGFFGFALVDHDGDVQYEQQRPTGDPVDGLAWLRPATIHDFDGDGAAEFAMSSADNYSVYEGDASIVWSSPVVDTSGIAAGTAFDFLGDGIAEAMYADEYDLFVFGDAGDVLLDVPRTSITLVEYPVVVDVDNDGSAEILVVSNLGFDGGMQPPAIQVIGDEDDRWIQARRIWNQHTYHVTNVREDGTIPTVEPRHWERPNTFRTNAQIEGGGICVPDPRG